MHVHARKSWNPLIISAIPGGEKKYDTLYNTKTKTTMKKKFIGIQRYPTWILIYAMQISMQYWQRYVYLTRSKHFFLKLRKLAKKPLIKYYYRYIYTRTPCVKMLAVQKQLSIYIASAIAYPPARMQRLAHEMLRFVLDTLEHTCYPKGHLIYRIGTKILMKSVLKNYFQCQTS